MNKLEIKAKNDYVLVIPLSDPKLSKNGLLVSSRSRKGYLTATVVNVGEGEKYKPTLTSGQKVLCNNVGYEIQGNEAQLMHYGDILAVLED